MDALLSILREAIRHVPVMKYALAVLGLVVVAVAAVRFNIGPAQTIVGAGLVLIGMVLVFLFSVMASLSKTELRLPALVLMWAVLLFAVAGGGIAFWKTFIGPNWAITGDWLSRTGDAGPPAMSEHECDVIWANFNSRGGSNSRGVSSNEALSHFLCEAAGFRNPNPE